VFLDHAKAAPVPNLCCRYHLNGVCTESCFFRASHVALTGKQTAALGKWIESCRARMPSRQPADAAKKPKLVGNHDTEYTFLPVETATPRTLPQNVGRAHNELLARSAAARLYASKRDTNWATLDRGGRFSGGPLARFASKHECLHYVAGRPSSFAIAFSRSSDVPCTDENDTGNHCDTDASCRKDTDDAASCTHHT
jgi:hypothetical protein